MALTFFGSNDGILVLFDVVSSSSPLPFEASTTTNGLDEGGGINLAFK